MEKFHLVMILGSLLLLVGGGGVVAYLLLGGKGSSAVNSGMRNLMGASESTASVPPGRGSAYDVDIDTIKRQAGVAKAKAKQEDLGTKLFRAGFFTADDKRRFLIIRMVSLGVAGILVPAGLYLFTGQVMFALIGLLLGCLIGFTLPMSWLERQIRSREEDILYYLPLVIEQVSIGVSSSLDVGPCITNIIQMANERDSHNPVTEMFIHVEKLMRSGLNLEGALGEVGEANGMPEVKHAFMFLAQCAKHGGEVSKQLQELADSVMVQRQVQVEAKITALPVKATGPLAMVFAGFFALLFAGLMVRLLGAFGA